MSGTRNLNANVHFAAFWRRFGGWAKIYSLPSIFIEGCGESSSPPGSTPLSRTCIGAKNLARSEREQDECVDVKEWAGCFPTACEGTSYLGMRDPPRPKTFAVHF